MSKKITQVIDPARSLALEAETRNPASDLRSRLHELLRRSTVGPEALELELRQLESNYPGEVHCELIHLLTHVRVDTVDAKHYWERIVGHRLSMQERLGTIVNLRVALMDYFVTVRPTLKNPKIIEMSLFDRTLAAVYRDELTGLHNYRFFCEQLAREVARCERTNTPVSLAMIDVDNLKPYNDDHGHEAGNRMLETLGKLLADTLRREDVAARYGGDEFALILPGTSKDGARVAAENVRSRIAHHNFGDEGLSETQITISIGIATFPADATTASELLQQADIAMYQAKSRGKNQLQLFGQSIRSHRRVEAALEGQFRVVAEESKPLTTVRIGGGGILFVSEQPLQPGSLVEIDLALPSAGRDIVVPARVIQVEPRQAGGFEIAVTVDSFDKEDRAALGQYVRDVSESS